MHLLPFFFISQNPYLVQSLDNFISGTEFCWCYPLKHIYDLFVVVYFSFLDKYFCFLVHWWKLIELFSGVHLLHFILKFLSLTRGSPENGRCCVKFTVTCYICACLPVSKHTVSKRCYTRHWLGQPMGSNFLQMCPPLKLPIFKLVHAANWTQD